MEPFSAEHFAQWARQLELDDGRQWEVEPYFLDFVRDVFSGYRVCWLVVGEENGKTTSVAGLALYALTFGRDPYIPVAASSREQAEWIYRQAEGFVRRSGLEARRAKDEGYRCLEGYRRIVYGSGRIQVFAADDRTGDGIIPGGLAILDELHRHRDLSLYRVWAGKLRKRGAQLVVISTAGAVGSEFERERERLRREATEISFRGRCFTRAAHELDDGTRLACLHDYAVPVGADVDDLELVKEANPFTELTIEALRAKRAMTHIEHWRRFVCGRPGRPQTLALSEQEWEAALSRTYEEIPPGQPIALGLDVGWRWDTTAAVPLWWLSHEERILGPAIVLEPPRDGSSLDPHEIEQAILEIHARNPIDTVVMDTTKAEQLAHWIAETTGALVIDRPPSASHAVDEYERFTEALRQRWLWHTGCPILRRHVLAAIVRILPGGDARFDRPSRSRTGPEQAERVIDALSAAAMVHAELARSGGSVREPAWGPL